MIRIFPDSDDLELSASLKDWIPDKIIDSHVHLHKNFGHTLLNSQAQNPGQTFNWFDLDMHKLIFNKLDIPFLDYRAIVFSLPFSETEKDNNNYLQRLALNEPGIYPIPCLTNENTIKGTFDPTCSPGLKTKIRTTAENEIINNFSQKLWDEINNVGNFIIIHLPKNIYENADELIFLANKYQNVHFIVAHLGGFYLLDDKFISALKKIVPCPNILFDTSMVTDSELIYSAISLLGCRRILFGSDAPFGYFKGKFLKHDGVTIFKPNCDWPWINPIFQPTTKSDTEEMVCLQSILAIKHALEKANKNDSENKNSIFFGNALKLLNGL